MQTRLLADIASPWNHAAKRFIEAPVYHLVDPRPPATHSNFWRLEMTQDGVRHTVDSDRPVLDAAPIWPKLRVGSWIQCNILNIDRDENWIVDILRVGAQLRGFTPVSLIAKAPDWDDSAADADQSPLDYIASLRANIAWFDSHENNPNAFYREPGMPAWWWHAAESFHPRKIHYQEGSFPSLASQAVGAYLTVAEVVPDKAEHCRRIAIAVGDWLIKNRTPMSGAAPGMPYTAMREGKFEYSSERDAINLSRGAMPGMAMLQLFQHTGERKYLDYARHMADIFIRFIREDGSMPYRIRAATGEVVEEYTTGNVLVALFLDALNGLSPDKRWPDASRRIVRWVCEHPMRDFNWKACFEDVGEITPYANLSGMDALWVVRLLCRHASEDPQHVARARKLLRWVEDQFVNFGEEASMPIRAHWPTVREQWLCDYPMEAHSSNYARSCWELYRATGDETLRRKSVATLNAIVRSQRRDGCYSTWGVDRERAAEGLLSGYNWFNTNHTAMTELSCFLLRQRGSNPLTH